ncbi:MAG: hypothetical protein BGP04_00540 [Rhizobiales bacterium 62-17]|nr:MAG: hypothetical protein BGP04_00540 [Rhizobiales bacterium 62-17]
MRRGVGPAAAFGAVAAGIGAAIAADRYNDNYYYGPGGYGYGYGPGYYDYGYNYGYYPPAAYYGPRYRHRYGHRPVYPRPNPGYPGPIYTGRPLGGATTAPIVPHGPIGGGVVRPNPGFGGGGIVRPQGLGGGGGGGFVGGGAAPLGGATTMTVR